MTRLWTALKRQPVRSYLYGVLVPAEAVAVSYGIVSDDRGVLLLSVAAAVLVVPATEAARAKVTPWPVEPAAGDKAEDV